MSTDGGNQPEMDNYILTYYQQIQDGTVSVCSWVRLAYQYLVKGLEDGLFYYDAKKADSQIRFIEEHCHHVEGRLAPGLFKLETWQKAAVAAIFGIVDKHGLRQFREIVMVEGRKCGKSLLGSSIGECVLYNDGEYGARGFCVAPKLDQADIIYGTMWASISLDPELSQKTKHRKSDLFIEESNSTMKKIAFNAKKSDGFNPSICICDEFASWPAEQGLKQYEVMKSAMGAREQPIMLAISTAGYVNDGIYDELMKRCTSFLLGNSKETRLLPLLYMIDDINKWNDINELRKSMPNLGKSVSYDYMIEEIRIAEGSLSKKVEFLCKYCNVKQNSSLAMLSAEDVRKCISVPLDLNDFRGCYCVGGIDLSRTTDLTAACIVIEKNGLLYVFCKFWLPAERIDEATAKDGLPYRAYIQRGLLNESGTNFVDYNDCYNWFRSLVEQYQIYPLKVGYDRYNSQYLTQDMKNYGFHMDDVYQGPNLSPVIDETCGLIRDGKICIGDNDLMKIHMLDSAVKMDTDSARKKLIKVSAKAHIDGMAALIDAMTVRQKWHSEIGGQLTNAGE